MKHPRTLAGAILADPTMPPAVIRAVAEVVTGRVTCTDETVRDHYFRSRKRRAGPAVHRHDTKGNTMTTQRMINTDVLRDRAPQCAGVR